MTYCPWLYTETDKIIREGKPITDINLPNKITDSIIPIVQPKIATPTIKQAITTPVTPVEVPKPVISTPDPIPPTVPPKGKNVSVSVSDNPSATDR